MVRNAFRGVLPDTILQRRTKGTPDSFAFAVVDTNWDKLRAMLLDGELRRQGLLDVATLDAVFLDRSHLQKLDHMRLSTLAEAEAWARHWHALSQKPPLGFLNKALPLGGRERA